MNRTKIEWCDYTVNPVKGLCPMACSYCYARAMYKRFGWNPGLRYDRGGPLDILWRNEPEAGSRIFVGSTMELFGEWIRYEWLATIFRRCVQHPKLTFIFLTKQPQNLAKWSRFPDNCWVGITATNEAEFLDATNVFYRHRVAKTQFISIEPLLSWQTSHWFHPLPSHLSAEDVDWLIIGQQTPASKRTTPRLEWLREIVGAGDRAGIKVFVKDNLRPVVLPDFLEEKSLFHAIDGQLRQEFPAGKE